MSDHRFIPKSNSKIVPPFIPKPKESLEAENARLKAEVEAYRSASDEVAAAFLALPAPHNQVGRVCEGIARLKAEVYTLKLGSLLTAVDVLQFIKLKEENERLTEIIRREVDGGVDLREEAQRTVEENHNLRAEVERLRKAGEWQPIETAPKDGTVIWATNSKWKRPDYVKWGCIDHIDEWAWVHTHNRHNRTPEPVTHWMPIPKPPQEGKPSV